MDFDFLGWLHSRGFVFINMLRHLVFYSLIGYIALKCKSLVGFGVECIIIGRSLLTIKE